MIINEPEVKKTLTDYDIVFNGGFAMPVTLDPTLGDTLEVQGETIEIHLAPKPSQHDPEKILKGEDITIFKRQVLSISRRLRDIVELSTEQRSDLHKTWKSLASHPTVQ